MVAIQLVTQQQQQHSSSRKPTHTTVHTEPTSPWSPQHPTRDPDDILGHVQRGVPPLTYLIISHSHHLLPGASPSFPFPHWAGEIPVVVVFLQLLNTAVTRFFCWRQRALCAHILILPLVLLLRLYNCLLYIMVRVRA